jgi:inner membrane transporter RhtA
MLALLPATATLVGIIVLAQIPSLRDTLGVALVMAGVAAHRPPAQEPRTQRASEGDASAAANPLLTASARGK